MNLNEIVKDLESRLQCNCDLDNWTPEQDTGHSHVCRIHKLAMEKAKQKQLARYYPGRFERKE